MSNAIPTEAPTCCPVIEYVYADGSPRCPVKASSSPTARLFKVGKFRFGTCEICPVIAETREQAAFAAIGFGKILFVSA